ncbi:MAG TPA: penicillin-binding transpeptidase domain-containing protein, partial [Pedobacter sp.]|nr:penicillin-binding transpeptidase domain-containing protein [Pedobacter sp.]
RGKNHSVFIGFAPRDNPKIAIAVIVENAGYGSTYAAPIASYITEKYLKDSISSSRKAQAERMKLQVVLPPPPKAKVEPGSKPLDTSRIKLENKVPLKPVVNPVNVNQLPIRTK